jgi:phage portal protein BeeE
MYLSVAKALGLVNPVEKPREFVAGGDYAAAAPTEGLYSPAIALSAYLNPWVYACVRAIAGDLAALPIVVKRRGEVIEGHWLPKAIANSGHPSSRTWREATVRDMLLAGRSTSVLLYSNLTGAPIGVRWAHPERVRVIPAADGTPLGYEIGSDTVKQYPPEAVLSVLTLGVLDGPDALAGVGATQVLHSDLTADQALAAGTARKARSGRPAAIYRPASKDVGQGWTAAQIAVIKTQIGRLFSDADGGVAVLGTAGAELDTLDWAPKDMDGPAQRTWTRDLILAVFGVPPVRLGVDAANIFATAGAQLTSYWTDLRGKIAPLDEAMTLLARRVDRDDSITVEHDFSGVGPLQAADSDILARIGAHIANGMDPATAYAYEGWDDVPEGAFTAPAAPATPAGQTPAPSPADDAPDDEDDNLDEDEDLATSLSDAADVLTNPDATDAERAEAIAALTAAAEALAARGDG